MLPITGTWILMIVATLFVHYVGRHSSVVAILIHHRMNIEDLQSVFHVENHEDVPDYELVQLHTIRKRDTSNRNNKDTAEHTTTADEQSDDGHKLIKLRAFGKSHELSLQPSSQLFKGNLKMWSAESNGNGSVSYTELPDTYIGEPYQDEANQAALLLHEDDKDGSLLMEGTIGHDLVVKPLPLHVGKYLNRVNNTDYSPAAASTNVENDEVFMGNEIRNSQISTDGFPLENNNNNNNNDDNTAAEVPRHHVVYRRHSEYNDDRFSDFAFMEAGEVDPDRMRYSRRKRRRRRSVTKREAPFTIYPEILVIVDYDGYRLHGGDNVQVKRYFVSFWNGVDLRYKLLKSPKVRISIAGLIISRGRDATPYLERNRVGRDAVDSAAALTDMGKYLFRERRLPVYDIAVAVTKLDMCRRHYQNDICNRGTAGFAYVGGACVVNKRLEKVNSVAIIEDTGGFSGIIVAAHEVGHLLGAVHDGSPPPTYLGGPGAEKCRWEDGYIMSDLRHSEKGFKWSACSVSSFHHFLNGDTATCLYNSPHEDESLPRVLPGKLLTLDAQCRRDRGTSACFKDERVCSQLFCFDSTSGYCVAYRPAAEGSPCGDGQTCSNGVCIQEHENIIPDYSQNTPSFIRRQDQDESYIQTKFLSNSTRRSEWEEFWKGFTNTPGSFIPTTTTTSTSTTPSPAVNFHHRKQQTTNPIQSKYDPYNFFKITSDQPYLDFHKSTNENGECVDADTSCYDYVSSYGLQYCTEQYMQLYCCAAVKYICNKSSLLL